VEETEAPRAAGRAARGTITLASGAGGIAVLEAEAGWLAERIGGGRDRSASLASLLLRTGRRRRGRVVNAVAMLDADPATRLRAERVGRVMQRLRTYTAWRRIPGPTAAQNPENIYSRLTRNEYGSMDILAGLLKEVLSLFPRGYVHCIRFTNSMHGTGMGVNTAAAELISKLTRSDMFRVMVALNADISRVTSALDYLHSTEWALKKIGELMSSGKLDTVVVIDNTVVSAVKSMIAGRIPKSMLRKAWMELARSEDPVEAAAGFYSVMARAARLDPHEANDLIVQAIAPLLLVPAWGPLLAEETGKERELRAASSPWDYYNVRRVTSGRYVVPGYMPGDMLSVVDFNTIAEELAVMTLAPISPSSVHGIVIVLGEEDRDKWEEKGIAMYDAIERSFENIGYDGPLDVLTLTGESGVWIYAVLDDIGILEAKFRTRPW